MIRNIREEYNKLKSQKEFFVLITIFALIFLFFIYNNMNYNNMQTDREINYESYISNYDLDLKKSVETLRDKINSPQIRFNDLLKSSINRQANAYEKLSNSNLNLKANNQEGILYLNNTSNIDNLVIIFVFFIGFLIFNFDRKYKMNSLIATIKYGSKNKAKAKLVLYFILTFMLALTTYLIFILVISKHIGFGDTSLNIQSFSSFVDSSLNINIAQYILIFLLQKLLAIILTFAICALFFSIFKDNRLQFIVFFVYIALSFFAYKYIPSNSILEFIKSLSIYSIIDVFSLYGKYSDVYIFFAIIDEYIFILFSSIILILLLFTISFYRFKNEVSDIDYIKKFSLINKLKIKSLTINETIRLLFDSKGFISILVILVISVLLFPKENKEKYDFERSKYLISLNEFKGPLNNDLLKRLDEKKLYYNSIEDEIDKVLESYDKGKISYIKRDNKINYLESEKSNYIGFEKVFNQVENAVKKVNSFNNLYLIDEKTSQYNFSYNKYNIIFSVIFYLCLIFVFSEMFFRDNELMMSDIIKSSKLGHLNILNTRRIIYFYYGLSIFLILTIVMWLYSKFHNMSLDINNLVQSYTNLIDLPVINVAILIALYILNAIVNIHLFVNLIIFINLKVRKRMSVYAILLSVTLLPLVIFYLNQYLNILSLNIFSNIFTIIFSFSNYGIIGYIVQFLLSLILSYILLKESKKEWIRI